MNKKILIFTGSRGEWGYLLPIMQKLKNSNHEVGLIVTNMHVDPNYGMTEADIINDGFEPDFRIYMNIAGSSDTIWARSLGLLLVQLPDIFDRFRPDLLLLAGDRAETFTAATAAFYSNIAIAHIQAGELSGHKDGMARHALGKLAHVHFASNKDAADRLLRLGEEDCRIHITGAPQLDGLFNKNDVSDFHKVCQKIRIDSKQPFVICIVHSSSDEKVNPNEFIDNIYKILVKKDIQQVWILPNNDIGSNHIANIILHLPKKDVRVTRNLARGDYASLLHNCKFIIGNSSSGILEAPSLGTISINLGSRQTGRLRSKTVIDVSDVTSKSIENAIDKADNMQGMGKDEQYGSGNSSAAIISILDELIIDDKLLNKFLVE
jgi:UDP-hydrolysing UDP-N-acetyl-D-glucosamine 2-epimerase